MLEIMSSLFQCLTFISKATNQKDNSYCQKIEFKESYWLNISTSSNLIPKPQGYK